MYFTDAQIQQMRSGAERILSQLGVCVPREDVRKAMADKGFKVKGDRVFIAPDRVQAQYARLHKPTAGDPGVKLSCSLSAYAHTYEMPDGTMAPITDESNARMAQYVTRIQKLWPILYSGAPGHPVDVPDYRQFFHQAINGYLWCPDAHITEPMDVRIAPYYFEAAQAMDRPIEGLPVYVSSPLMIAGESLDIVLGFAHRLKHIHVTCMPTLGANTPLNLIAAYAQAIAETLGGAVVVEEFTGVPAGFSPTLFNMDFRAMTMAFGAPEKLLLEWLNTEVACRLAGGDVVIGATDIHVMIHKAGVQASVEKAMLSMAGAMRGARHMHTVGSLGMDEVFSPVQLLLDVEMLTGVQRILEGMPIDDCEADIVETVRAGLGKGHMGEDYTLDNMGRYVWYPRLFTRKSFNALMQTKVTDAMALARSLAREQLNLEPVWQLSDARAKALRDIQARAVRAVEGA